MVNLMLACGYVVIEADGQKRDNGEGQGVDFHPDRLTTPDQTTFLIAVADDPAARFRLKRDKMLLAGLSIGGSMTGYIASQAPDAFASHVPVAGSLWRPHQISSAGPERLLCPTARRTGPSH